MAVYAVSRTREVGIDIEQINAQFAHDQIPERFFSAAEVAALRALPESLQIEAFFQIWTRKEAYVKARGLGLSLPLDSFDVSLGEPARFLRGTGGWSIESIEPAPGYAAALVAQGD
jgi:4'-phosphopantetheinyl transferase